MDGNGSLRWALQAEAIRLRRELDFVLRQLRKLEGAGMAEHNAEMERLTADLEKNQAAIDNLAKPGQ